MAARGEHEEVYTGMHPAKKCAAKKIIPFFCRTSFCQTNNATMLSRSNFLTRIVAAHGILATGSLWADNKIVSAQSQPLHHDLK